LLFLFFYKVTLGSPSQTRLLGKLTALPRSLAGFGEGRYNDRQDRAGKGHKENKKGRCEAASPSLNSGYV